MIGSLEKQCYDDIAFCFTVHRFICVYVCVFVFTLCLPAVRMCCVIVTQWGGPGGLKPDP